MNYQKPVSNEVWEMKEKRELFGKAVNSILMTNKDLELSKVLEMAKEIVDTAFKNFSLSEEQKTDEQADFGELPLKTIKND